LAGFGSFVLELTVALLVIVVFPRLMKLSPGNSGIVSTIF
jgi:hypothetical protein